MTQTASLPGHAFHEPFLPSNFYKAPQSGIEARRSPTISVPHRSTLRANPTTDTASPVRGRRGRPPVVHVNTLKSHLEGYSSPGHALAKLSGLGSVATGAVSLDYGGNSKPLGIKTALVLLRRLDVISTDSIRGYMELSLRPCTERHAQRLAQCMRIIERAARELVDKWPVIGHIDAADAYITVHSMVPCSEQGCSICRPSVHIRDGWSLKVDDADSLTIDYTAELECKFKDQDGWADLEADIFDTE